MQDEVLQFLLSKLVTVIVSLKLYFLSQFTLHQIFFVDDKRTPFSCSVFHNYSGEICKNKYVKTRIERIRDEFLVGFNICHFGGTKNLEK